MSNDTDVPAPIKKELDDLKERMEYVEGLIPHARVAEQVLAEYGPRHKRDAVSVGSTSGGLKGVLIHLHVNDLKEVLPVIRALRQRGYKVIRHDDYAEIKRRSYYMDKIIVSAFLDWDETGEGLCRFVKKGTEVKDVYALECDGVPVEDPNLVTKVQDPNLVAE